MDSAGGSSPQVEDSQKWHENGSSIGLDRPLEVDVGGQIPKAYLN